MKKQIISLFLTMPLMLVSCAKKPVSNSNSAPNKQVETSFNSNTNASKKPDNNSTKTNQSNSTNKSTESSKAQQSIDISKLSMKENSWFYEPHTDGSPSGEPKNITTLVDKYSSYYLGDTSQKIIYLTFDEGYENGYSSKILDVLKANNIKAAFFVTTPYINGNKALVKRMVSEGHLVCNHSTTHPSMASVAANKGKEAFDNEILTAQKTFEDLTGTKMPRFFRPPMGKYSEQSLYYTKALGYKTIFWSFAYEDWDPAKQPTHENAIKVLSQRRHGGGIYLLHAVSKTNTEILDGIIKQWKADGFEFKSLEDLPDK